MNCCEQFGAILSTGFTTLLLLDRQPWIRSSGEELSVPSGDVFGTGSVWYCKSHHRVTRVVSDSVHH